MKLITENGQLDLNPGFSFAIEQNSPVFSHDGTQSVPATLPTSPNNLKVLGNPTRSARDEKYVRKLSAQLNAGVFQKNGQLIIDSVEMKSGIVGAVMLNESDLYSKIKDVKLTEIFGKIIRNDYQSEPDPVKSWYDHIYACMAGTAADDFTAFPVAVNYNKDTGYEILNEPDYTSGLNPWDLKWRARSVSQGGETISLPAGYGITPFLWMWRIIELLFLEYGYKVGANPFKNLSSSYCKVVLVNNTADTICPGKITYSDLVPSCTVSEFLLFLETKFLIHAYINSDNKTVDLISLESILNSTSDLDITPLINGEIKHTFFDPLEVDMSSDISLDAASPAAETIFDLLKKYTTLTRMDENTWRRYLWGDLPAYKHHLVQRTATGVYYDIYFRRAGGQVPTAIKCLGSNYFRYNSGKCATKEYKASDVMPPMVYVTIGMNGSAEINIVCPYIGESRNINTIGEGEEKSSSNKQEIILAYAAGKAAEQGIQAFNEVYAATWPAKYFLGTTQKYNNAGVAWTSSDLTTTDLYKAFFRSWNLVLKNSGTEVECRVDYPDKQLLSFKMSRPKLLNGQKLLPKSLAYQVSSSITHTSSQFMLIKPSDATEQAIPFES